MRGYQNNFNSWLNYLYKAGNIDRIESFVLYKSGKVNICTFEMVFNALVEINIEDQFELMRIIECKDTRDQKRIKDWLVTLGHKYINIK